MKKKIFSIILPALFLISGIAFAFNVQDEAVCSQPLHKGYSSATTPPLPFNPDAPLPSGMTDEGQYGVNFNCITNQSATCHWVYQAPDPQDPNDEGAWIQCSGNLNRITSP